MNEPRRWRNDDAPDEIRRMLSVARPTDGMPSDAAERVSRRLGVAVASGAGFFGLLSWKALALAATLSATSVGAVLVVQRLATHGPVEPSASARAAHTREVAPVAKVRTDIVPPPVAAKVEATPEFAAPVVVARPASRVKSEPVTSKPEVSPSSEDTLAREIELLGRARAELDQQPRKALRDVDEHARTFANGKLALERELLALDVLDRLGRHAEAQARGQRLLQQARGTIYEERIRARIVGR